MIHCNLQLMPLGSVIRIGSQHVTSPFNYILNPLKNQILKFPKTNLRFLQMVHQSGLMKRSTCPSCSKPTIVCLCDTMKTPALHNSVAVTILQHSLEKKHPLNSARIATLGLRNVDVVTVSDVNFQARFFIRLLDSGGEMDRIETDGSCNVFDEMSSEGDTNGCVDESVMDGQVRERDYFDGAKIREICKDDTILPMRSSRQDVLGGNSKEDAPNEDIAAFQDSKFSEINFTIEKYGAIMSFDQSWAATSKWRKVDFDQLLHSDVAVDDLRKGFVVKKLQSKPVVGSDEYEELEEFDFTVPPGSVLLFPSEESLGIEALTVDVKNLIVLDGTWAKAKRMYKENPWLKFLPHIRLDINELSLYAEVRHQPKAEFLSTIESIVYALKGVGEEPDGLDGLLDVFRSMVGHQRRCKDERLSNGS
ncbi:uncharacterized protein [Henckelia pumila]|uniref:uncharacterized protein n=1 Tax=Henckelia pumila TaxID=405737 RepID=UPI003C6E12F3